MKNIFLLFLTLLLAWPVAGNISAHAATQSGPKRLIIQGSKILDDQGNVIRLRGGNLKGITEEQADELAGELKFNFVRLRLSFEPPNVNATGDGFTDAYKAQIDEWIRLLSARKVWIDIEMRGNDNMTNSDEFYTIGSTMFNNYLKTWMYIAQRYKDTDYIAGYGLLAEPSVNHTKHEDKVKTLTTFQKTLMDHISTVDPRTPFIVGTDFNYDTFQYRFDQYYTDLQSYKGRLIYAVNFLTPKEWIRTGKWTVDQSKPVYPQTGEEYTEERLDQLIAEALKSREGKVVRRDKYGNIKNEKEAEPIEKVYNEWYVKDGYYQMTLTPIFSQWYMKTAIAFKDRNQVPMVVDQFGASTDSNGQLAYERDLIDIFERNDLHWCRWGYNAGSDNRKIVDNPEVKQFYVNKMNSLLAGK